MILPGTRILRVVANPYSSLDGLGRLAGRVQLDPDAAAGALRYIGARIEADILVRFAGEGRDGRPVYDPRGTHVQDTRWSFSGAAVEIPETPHHRTALRDGSLLAADVVTHRAVFGGLPFVEPAQALARARSAALAVWAAEHDEPPAFLADEPPAAATDPKPAGKPATK